MTEQWYRNVILPGFETWVKRRNTFGYLRELNESQWWSSAELERLQLDRLVTLLKKCHRDVPWYRQTWNDRGLDVREVGSLEDFSKFPITTRAMMRQHAASFRSTDPRWKTVSKSTGGSTGMPLQFVIEQQSNDRRIAATFRGYDWAGAGPGTKQSHLWSVTLGQRTRLRAWKEYGYHRWLNRRDMLNSFELSAANAADYVRRMDRYQPDVIVAYANAIYLLARMMRQQGLRMRPPKAIVVGAEKMHDFQRSLIQDVVGAPVFETYGSREFTLIGAECEHHDGLHLSAENLILEVVDDDGSPTGDGQEGHIVVTDLFNHAMPFVRYAIGDRAMAGLRKCPCGRGLPLLRQVVGRQADSLRLPDGRVLSGVFFPHLLKDYAAIRQFQIIQSRPDLIEMKLAVDELWDEQQLASLNARLAVHLGRSTRWSVGLVKDIPTTAAGKARIVVAHDAITSLAPDPDVRVAG